MVAGMVYLVSLGMEFVESRPGKGNRARNQFKTGVITRGTLENLVSSTGTLAAVGTVNVGTQVSGTIEQVLADYNDEVKQGQVLARLDQALFQASVTEARARVIQALASLAKARAEYDRNRPLMEQGHLSAQEFLIMETEFKAARGMLMAARGVLKRARVNLDNATIRSPINGKVIERSIEAGQTVAASYSTPTLFVIAEDLSKMQIEADVDESDIGRIRRDQEVRFTVQTFPDRVFDGRVSQIRLNPVVVSNVVTYTVVVAAPNDRGLLLPGMTATVDFVVERVEDALLAPAPALNFTPGDGNGSKASTGNALFVSDNGGPPRRVPVTPGVSNGAQTEVRGRGVAEDMVVLVGINRVKAEAKKGFFTWLLGRRPPKKRK
ncbi:MAG: efflux RND transporter periplasmic adaptor subunit [Desulfobacteraceae bacterium]|nr:efflux RND transporter periplasmic adaptor subunit [Desulfobacteraceae bacterium]